MAVAEVRTGGAQVNGSNVTVSIDGTSGTCLVVGIAGWISGSTPNGSFTVTYNAVSATLRSTGGQFGEMNTFVFTLANPTTGSNDLVITATGNIDKFAYGYAVLSGALGSPDATGEAAGSSAEPEVSLTTTKTDDFMYCAATGDQAGADPSFAAGTNSTAIATLGTRNAGMYKYSTNPLGVPAGETMAFTMSGSRNYTIASVAIQPNFVTVAETVTATETKTIIKQGVISKLETITGTEVMTAIRARLTTVLDTITASEVMSAFIGWIRQAKNASSYSQQSKNTSTWTNNNESAASWTHEDKS